MRHWLRHSLAFFANQTERLVRLSGWCAAITVFIAILFTSLSAFATKLGFGSNALIELQWYCFSFIFLSAGAWTLAQNEHVRVDALSRYFSTRSKARIELIGHIFFLLPLCVLLIYLGTSETLTLLHSGERSADAGGLIRWPVKALIPLGFTLLLCQLLLHIAQLLPTAFGSGHFEHSEHD